MLYIIGSGGHARVVGESAVLLGHSIQYITEDSDFGMSERAFFEMIQSTDEPVDVICGVGSVSWMEKRREIIKKFIHPKIKFKTIIDPRAIVSDSSQIGDGVYIAQGSNICPFVTVESHSIINTGVIVDHNSHVGSNCHVATGTVLCGGVRIGANCMIGAGSILIQDTFIAESCLIGAGSLLVRSVRESKKLLLGSPAKTVEPRTT